MSTFTEHYSLIMPSQEDYYDVQDFNENTEALDGLLFEQETAIANVGEKVDGVAEKIGHPGDEGEDTLFGVISQNRPTELFYRPDRESVQFQYPNTVITNSEDSVLPYTMYLHLFSFRAAYDGSIYLRYNLTYSSAPGHPNYTLYIYENAVNQLLFLSPPFSALGALPPGYDAEITYPYQPQHLINVKKGHTYSFVLFYQTVDITINNFKVCYDVGPLEDTGVLLAETAPTV